MVLVNLKPNQAPEAYLQGYIDFTGYDFRKRDTVVPPYPGDTLEFEQYKAGWDGAADDARIMDDIEREDR